MNIVKQKGESNIMSAGLVHPGQVMLYKGDLFIRASEQVLHRKGAINPCCSLFVRLYDGSMVAVNDNESVKRVEGHFVTDDEDVCSKSYGFRLGLP